MPKKQTINVKSFDEISQESTEPVVHLQKPKEEIIAQPVQQKTAETTTTAPTQENSFSPTPSKPLSEIYADQKNANIPIDESIKKRSIFTGKNFHNVDFEEDHEFAMRICTAMTKTKFADIIRASVDEFLRQHYNDGRLTPQGIEIIQAYKEKTKV